MQFLPNALQHAINGISGSGSAPGPIRIVLDNINAGTSNVVFDSYEETGKVPHFTLDPYRQEVWQHLPFDESAVGVTNPPIEPHRMGRTVWVNVMKTAPLTAEESFWAGREVALIADEVQCVDHWLEFPSEFSREYRTSQLGLGLWRSFEGICGAAHVPHTPGNGPGAMELESFHEGLLLGAISDNRPEEEGGVIVIETDEVLATVVVQDPTISEQTSESALGAFPGRKVQLGSGGKAVNMLREAFGLSDGKFDDELNEKVLDAQNAAGMTTDGIVDRETWEAIAEYLKE